PGERPRNHPHRSRGDRGDRPGGEHRAPTGREPPQRPDPRGAAQPPGGPALPRRRGDPRGDPPLRALRAPRSPRRQGRAPGAPPPRRLADRDREGGNDPRRRPDRAAPYNRLIGSALSRSLMSSSLKKNPA